MVNVISVVSVKIFLYANRFFLIHSTHFFPNILFMQSALLPNINCCKCEHPHTLSTVTHTVHNQSYSIIFFFSMFPFCILIRLKVSVLKACVAVWFSDWLDSVNIELLLDDDNYYNNKYVIIEQSSVVPVSGNVGAIKLAVKWHFRFGSSSGFLSCSFT